MAILSVPLQLTACDVDATCEPPLAVLAATEATRTASAGPMIFFNFGFSSFRRA
jgi:hypothetical protein